MFYTFMLYIEWEWKYKNVICIILVYLFLLMSFLLLICIPTYFISVQSILLYLRIFPTLLCEQMCQRNSCINVINCTFCAYDYCTIRIQWEKVSIHLIRMTYWFTYRLLPMFFPIHFYYCILYAFLMNF